MRKLLVMAAHAVGTGGAAQIADARVSGGCASLRSMTALSELVGELGAPPPDASKNLMPLSVIEIGANAEHDPIRNLGIGLVR